MSLAVITTLAIICFVAITAYCVVVAWPRLQWSAQSSRRLRDVRQPSRAVPSLYDVDGHNRSTARPRLLKK